MFVSQGYSVNSVTVALSVTARRTEEVFVLSPTKMTQKTKPAEEEERLKLRLSGVFKTRKRDANI